MPLGCNSGLTNEKPEEEKEEKLSEDAGRKPNKLDLAARQDQEEISRALREDWARPM